MLLLLSGDFFQKKDLLKKIFQEHIRVSNGLDPDVGPDLGPKCLHRLSANDTSSKEVFFLKNGPAVSYNLWRNTGL